MPELLTIDKVKSENIPHISCNNKTYVAYERREKDFTYYSKAWHRKYGPKIVISRFIYIISDNATWTLVDRPNRWQPKVKDIPNSGMYKTLVSYIPIEDLLTVHSNDSFILLLVKTRLVVLSKNGGTNGNT